MERKGMNAVLMVVVTAVVLLMTALTLIFITQGGLSNFLETAQGEGAKGVCIGKRNTVCQTPTGEIWDPASMEYQEENCAKHLDKKGEIYVCDVGWGSIEEAINEKCAGMQTEYCGNSDNYGKDWSGSSQEITLGETTMTCAEAMGHEGQTYTCGTDQGSGSW